MARKGRRQITVPDKNGLRYAVMAAIADFEIFKDRPLSNVLVMLVWKGLDVMYGKRETFPRFLAKVLADPRYEWARELDSLEVFADTCLLDSVEIENLLLGKCGPSAEQVAAIMGSLDQEHQARLRDLLNPELDESAEVKEDCCEYCD